MNCIPYGPHALLLRFANAVGDEAFARGRAIVAELERHPPPGLNELVPAFTTVLLEFNPGEVPVPAQLAPELVARLENIEVRELPPSPLHEIPVCYDGPDLDRVARAHDLSATDVVTRHSAPIYKVCLLGFSPGFPYLGDLDARLHTPRLPSPRLRVRAGAVAIGGEHTGIYSVEGPGGWNILGHTPLKIFDPARRVGGDEKMFLLKPGDRVKFLPEKMPASAR